MSHCFSEKQDTSDQIGIHSKFLPQCFQVIPNRNLCNNRCCEDVSQERCRKRSYSTVYTGGNVDICNRQASLIGRKTEELYSRPPAADWSPQIFSIKVPAASYYASAKNLKRRLSQERSPFLIQFTLLNDFLQLKMRSQKWELNTRHISYNKMFKTLLPIYIFFFLSTASKTELTSLSSVFAEAVSLLPVILVHNRVQLSHSCCTNQRSTILTQTNHYMSYNYTLSSIKLMILQRQKVKCDNALLTENDIKDCIKYSNASERGQSVRLEPCLVCLCLCQQGTVSVMSSWTPAWKRLLQPSTPAEEK